MFVVQAGAQALDGNAGEPVFDSAVRLICVVLKGSESHHGALEVDQ